MNNIIGFTEIGICYYSFIMGKITITDFDSVTMSHDGLSADQFSAKKTPFNLVLYASYVVENVLKMVN